MTVLLKMTSFGVTSKCSLSLAECSYFYQLCSSPKPLLMLMAICWLVMMASTKQKSTFCRATSGQAWMQALLPISNPATDVKSVVKMTAYCLLCSSRLPSLLKPNQRIHAEYFDPLKTSDSGKKFILCMTDAVTKYVKLVPLLKKEVATVASTLFG
jgi:hypothetical protein